MFATVDPRSPVPLYDQIAERVRTAVATGELRPGDALPSVRQLAGRLRINPATVVQAYRSLESQGFVEIRQGSGTFVRLLHAGTRDRERAAQARRLVRALLGEAARLGLSRQDLRNACRHELDGGTG